MAIPERRKSRNHELSIRKHIKDNYATPHGITVDYGDQMFNASGHDLWVDVSFLSSGAGRKGETLAQFDVYSRVRGKQGSGDRMLNDLADAVQKLVDVMHVDCIQVYDFSDQENPSLISKAKLMVQNSGGTFREPEADQYVGIEDGVTRRTLTYRVRMVEDASQAASYFD